MSWTSKSELRGLSAVRRGGFRLAIFLTAGLLVLVTAPPVASAAVSNAAQNNQKMLQFMNQERAARGLPALSRDSRLDSLAQSWANKMAAERKMYHPSPPQAMSSAGYRSGAQNLAYHDNSLSASWAHNVWMNSAVHRKNILDPAFTHAGLAIACNPSGRPYVLVAVEFGGSSTPLSSAPPKSPHVAGGSSSGPEAGCDGSADPEPDPRPTVTPPPAPAAPARAPDMPADQGSPNPSAATRASAAGVSPTPSEKPLPQAKSPSKIEGTSPTPGPADSPPVIGEPDTAGAPAADTSAAQPESPSPTDLGPLAAASSGRAEPRPGPLVTITMGLAALFVISRLGSKRHRVPPRHSVSRR